MYLGLGTQFRHTYNSQNKFVTSINIFYFFSSYFFLHIVCLSKSNFNG
jgi:hypothetical protein